MLKWVLTGGVVPIFLLAVGVFYLFYLQGYPFRAPRRMLGALQGERTVGGVSPFRAVMQALAGTLGVGNIVGVANAIVIGGAGAVFWMWISALLAMILKYAEILLAVAHRREARDGSFFGGAVYYIRDWFWSRQRVRFGAVVSAVFAGLMILDALCMGCVIQVRAVTSAVQGVSAIPAWGCAVALILLTLPLLLSGTRGISALTEYLVPIMTAGYVLLSAAVLILRHDAVGEAFASIFREAFTPASGAGGVIGFLTSRALRVGTMRGLLSNEAGCGTAPTAHAAADAKSPAAQGVWGIFEVFVDTILLCTATALVILVSRDEVSLYASDGVMMAIRAYSTVLGDWAAYFFAAAILCFGYATLLCWGGYGLESVRFLSPKKRWRGLYLIAFAACVAAGSLYAPDAVWDVADFAIASMTYINLMMLLLLRREVRTGTREAFGKEE
ncbi:MAG: sodium:alanine symporter family protein [Clostridia bacterium]|nr:sodium:alanine symporter family protein [Clostridia bacterium]